MNVQEWSTERDPILADPARALKLIKGKIGEGDYLLAIEIAESLLERKETQSNPKVYLLLRQQLALAFSRAGFIDKAKAVLDKLYAEAAPDSETFGLLGSIYKSMWAQAKLPAEKTHFLLSSRDYYRSGFESTGASYLGINAASLSVLLDDTEMARTLAQATLEKVPQNEDFWDLGTAAEAHLNLGQLDEARALYTRAAQAAHENWTHIATMRKQCRLLCQKLQRRSNLLDDCFPSSSVAFFSGHVIDADDRKVPRFPAAAIPGVMERIQGWLTKNAIRFTYSSAATGSDILFLEIAQSLGLKTNILLPFARDYFVQTSVKIGGDEWVARFDQVMKNAVSVTTLSDDFPEYHSSSYEFTNRMIPALAAAQAAATDSPLLGLAVWNGELSETSGGTSYALNYWGLGQLRISIINPTNPARDGRYDADVPALESPFPRIYTADPLGVQTEVASLLLLRFTGYPSMRESDFQKFIQNLLGGLSSAMAKNDWFPARYGFGDRYLFAWEKVRQAGMAAVEFMARLQAGKQDCPPGMDFSLCLHSAPVQLMVNPVLNQYAHEGAAVSKLEALSLKLSPGLVFATETFASLVAFEKIRDFKCEYSGTIRVSDQAPGTRIYQVSA